MVWALAAVASAQQSPRPGPAPCLDILVSSHEETPGPARTSFSATKTTDLTFHVLLAEFVFGERVLELRTTTPHGFLYRSISVPIAVGPPSAAFRRIPGYPSPVQVVPAVQDRFQNAAVLRVDVPFPLGGTDIATGSLYGRWQVQGFLDGSRLPCGAPRSFELTQ